MSDEPIKKNTFIKVLNTSGLTTDKPVSESYWINAENVVLIRNFNARSTNAKATHVAMFGSNYVTMAGHVGSDVARMLNEHLDPGVACKCCNQPEPDDPEEPAEEEDDDSE